MILEKRRLTMYRATRKVYRLVVERSFCENCGELTGVDSVVVTQAKWHRSRTAAYTWIAYGMLYRMRDDADGYDRDETRCRLCAEAKNKALAGADPGPHPWTCRWHDRVWMAEKAERIARLIRHYDEKGIEP
jgi:hypothetical protein